MPPPANFENVGDELGNRPCFLHPHQWPSGLERGRTAPRAGGGVNGRHVLHPGAYPLVKGREMKNARPSKTESSAHINNGRNLTPRQRRVINALLNGPVWREGIDAVAGASNGPQVIMELRHKGLAIDCQRIDRIDRDGRPTQPGRYFLLELSRHRAIELLGGGNG